MIQQPYRIINAENPRSTLQIDNTYPSNVSHSQQDIQQENERLRVIIEKVKRQKEIQEGKINQQIEPQGNKAEFARRFGRNAQKIRELQNIVASQERVIQGYREKFKDFQDNLFKVMKLDKDIHHRLVNPQPNSTLETNVRNVLVALNGKAPYDKLLKMIESIRV